MYRGSLPPPPPPRLAFGGADDLQIDADLVLARLDQHRQLADDAAVHLHAALEHEFLAGAAGRDAATGEELLDALGHGPPS